MQKSLQEKVRGMLQRQKVRRRMAALLTVLSLCAAMGIFSLQMRPAATLSADADASATDLTPYITSVTITDNGSAITSGAEVGNGDKLDVSMAFSLPAGVITTANRSVQYQIPDGITVSAERSGNIFDKNNTRIASYTISTDGLITITAADDFADGSIMSGTVEFSGSASNSSTTDGKTVSFGDKSDTTITVKPDTSASGSDLSIGKWCDQKDSSGAYDGKFHYTIDVSTTKGTADTISLTDTMKDSYLVYDPGSFVVTGPHGTLDDRD